MKEQGPKEEWRIHGEHVHHWGKILGTETHWVEQGEGPPMVLLHPINSEWAHFEKVVPIFASNYHVYALDLPGIGGYGRKRELERHQLSDYSLFLEAFFDQGKIDKAVILGSSAGGMVALNFSLDHKERVLALIFQDTPTEFQPFMKLLPALTRLRGGKVVAERIFDTILPHILYAAWRTGFDPVMKKFSDKELLKFTRRMKHFSPRANLELLEDAMSQNLLEKAENINVPTLIIAGEEDIFPTPRMTRRFARHMPNAKMKLIEGGDHNLPVWKPNELAEEVLEFVNGLASKST